MKLPDNVTPLGNSPEFDSASVPAALLSQHALSEERWARLEVLAGTVTFFDMEDGSTTPICVGEHHVIPPLRPHRIQLDDGTRFRVDFFEVRG